MINRFSFFVLFTVLGRFTYAQQDTLSNRFDAMGKPLAKSIFKPKYARTKSRKGNFFGHWGYNFSWYGKSDLHMEGPGYDFVLKDVVAHDRPTKLTWKYLDPSRLTIPQFNFHLGYFIKDNYSISIGWDHMKYVMDVPQTVKITGYIDPEVSIPAISTGNRAGVYQNEDITVTPDFLTFEHTDGFNYASVELERYDDVWVSPSGTMSLNTEGGVGIGAVVPRTDVRYFGVGENNYWNIAGYGGSLKAGLKFYFNPHLFLQGSMKAGWTNLTSIHTTGRNDVDKANQKITFLENYWVIGFQF